MDKRLVCIKCGTDLRFEKNRYFCLNCRTLYPIKGGIYCFVNSKVRNTSSKTETLNAIFEMEKNHFWNKGRKEIIYQILQYATQVKKNSLKMLEIGCGNGNVLSYLKSKGIDIEGIDISIEALHLCRKRCKTILYQADGKNMPFPDASYDVIGMFDLIEHIDNEQLFLSEAFRICKDGGILIITVPAYKSLWSYFDNVSGHKRRYGKNELIMKLRQAGFEIVKISFYIFFLFLPYVLFRQLNILKKGATEQDFSKLIEVKTIPVLNSIFLAFLIIESRLLKRFNLPFGSSLICVAKK